MGISISTQSLIMDLVGNNMDVFLLNDSFPDHNSSKEFSIRHRTDRSLGGGGLLIYVNESIPSRKLKVYNLPDEIEIFLKKQKWAVIGIFNPPKMKDNYFWDQLRR